MIVDINELLSA